MNKRRIMGMILAACLALALFRGEWQWGRGLEEIFWLRVVTATAPLGILLISGFLLGAFRYRGSPRRLILLFLGAGLFGATVLMHTMSRSEFEAHVRPDFYVVLVQMAVCAAVGYWMAADLRDTRWALSRCAFGLAALALYAGIARGLGLGDAYVYLVPSYPVSLLIGFAFCWYLSHFLLGKTGWIWPLLGILACSVELIVPFRKPIIPGLVIASAVIFLCCLWTASRRFAVFARGILLVTVGLSAVFAANQVSSGRLTELLGAKIRTKYLHETRESRHDTLVKTIERASAKRFILFQEGLARFEASPAIGTGFGPLVSLGLREPRAPKLVHVHNGYLDLLMSAGLIGSIPVFVGILWWLALVFRPTVLERTGALIIPLIGYFFSIAAYNIGACSRTFFSLNSFTVFLMAIAVGVADHALPVASLRREAARVFGYHAWPGRFGAASRL
jgi:O-antigen ligase